jgi:hypothetical protein
MSPARVLMSFALGRLYFLRRRRARYAAKNAADYIESRCNIRRQSVTRFAK